MQRVRIGLTGLAAVFLLVVLAASIFGLASDERPVGNDTQAAAQANEAAVPKEPLAELGVTPGGSPATTNSTQPLPSLGGR